MFIRRSKLFVPCTIDVSSYMFHWEEFATKIQEKCQFNDAQEEMKSEKIERLLKQPESPSISESVTVDDNTENEEKKADSIVESSIREFAAPKTVKSQVKVCSRWLSFVWISFSMNIEIRVLLTSSQ